MSELKVCDLIIDQSVVVYTRTKCDRPWIGIIVKVTDESLTLHWLKKERRNMYYLLNLLDGSPSLSEVPVESVMFVDVLQNLSGLLDRSGPYSIDSDMKRQIMDEYKKKDSALQCSNVEQNKNDFNVLDEVYGGTVDTFVVKTTLIDPSK